MERQSESYNGAIFSLIPKIMAEVGAIEKNSKNASQNYKFRGIDDVMTAFQPVMARHGVFFVPEVLSAAQTDRESAKGSALIYTQLTVGFTFYAADGSNVRAVVVGEAMDSGDKSSNKAMSAALKYALLQTFCVPVESSDDADAHTPELARKQLAKPSSGRKQVLLQIVSELTAKGVEKEKLQPRAVQVCQRQDASFANLTDAEIELLIADFSVWLDSVTSEGR
jgi:hypothetical protein